MSMLEFSRICEQIAATAKKTEKTRLIAQYIENQDTEPAAIACAFLSGRPFPAFEEAILSVGGALMWRALGRIVDLADGEVAAAYRRTGDTGAAAERLLAR